ncbi:hypothetical protein DdX_09237 [Ditylenchus destructor]|uniref:Uncharacterized protein n=1 Tax=Ditylenchus destructor TaxID=166010 RepID=A0AAD4R0B3_9BILA|nr:hypothetical protein DdX_09237 [Ditylenchus destructor]
MFQNFRWWLYAPFLIAILTPDSVYGTPPGSHGFDLFNLFGSQPAQSGLQQPVQQQSLPQIQYQYNQQPQQVAVQQSIPQQQYAGNAIQQAQQAQSLNYGPQPQQQQYAPQQVQPSYGSQVQSSQQYAPQYSQQQQYQPQQQYPQQYSQNSVQQPQEAPQAQQYQPQAQQHQPQAQQYQPQAQQYQPQAQQYQPQAQAAPTVEATTKRPLPSFFGMTQMPHNPPVPTKPPPEVEPFYTFADGSVMGACAYGLPPPTYTIPTKKCVPYHPMCGVLFTCILDV